jgi:hypothetical protein
MALESTQRLTEMSTRNISLGVKAAGALDWQPYHLHVLIVLNSGSLNLLEPWGAVQACTVFALPLSGEGKRCFLRNIVFNKPICWMVSKRQSSHHNTRSSNSLKCLLSPPVSKVKTICRALAVTLCDRQTDRTSTSLVSPYHIVDW